MNPIYRKEEEPSWDYLIEYHSAEGVMEAEGRVREATSVFTALMQVCSELNINLRNVSRYVCAQGD